MEVIIMCPWEDIAKAVISDDLAAASELLARNECLLTAVRMKLRGPQKEPEDIAQEVQEKLLTRWVNIRGAVISAGAGKQLAEHIGLFRKQINWLIQTALGRDKPTGISLSRSTGEGEEFTIDPAAPEDRRPEATETEDQFWDHVSKLKNIRSRILLKFLGVIAGTSNERAKLTDAEPQWRPDPRVHPNSRKAAEVAVALNHRILQDPNLAAPNDWLGREFGLTSSKPQTMD